MKKKNKSYLKLNSKTFSNSILFTYRARRNLLLAPSNGLWHSPLALLCFDLKLINLEGKFSHLCVFPESALELSYAVIILAYSLEGEIFTTHATLKVVKVKTRERGSKFSENLRRCAVLSDVISRTFSAISHVVVNASDMRNCTFVICRWFQLKCLQVWTTLRFSIKLIFYFIFLFQIHSSLLCNLFFLVSYFPLLIKVLTVKNLQSFPNIKRFYFCQKVDEKCCFFCSSSVCWH